MSSNLDKLNKLNPNHKKDLNRHKQLEKRIADVVKVTKDPDKWNANIASRDRVDAIVDEITELREEIKRLNGRIDGLNYLMKQIIKT